MHQVHHAHSRPQNETLLEARELSYTYPDGTQALHGIDLQLNSEERIALVGHNGSGKTTLVKQLCGLLSPQQGEVRFRGELFGGEYLERMRLKIGLLFQDPDDQLFGHSIFEDVAFGLRNQGLAEADVDREVREAVAAVGLSDYLYKAPHALSYGQKKRAALAGLLALQPDLLILDEPTANLDPKQEQLFLDLLKGFSGALLLISHDLIFLYELCQRAVVLDRGHVHHDYTMKELVEHRPSLREHGLDFSFRFAEAAAVEAESQDVAGRSAQTDEKPPADPLPANGPLIELQDLRYRYPDGTRALHGINLQVQSGERIALVGENGAGKSTLLMSLLGLLHHDGSYRFDQRAVRPGKGRLVWEQTGMVFQDSADQLVCPTCFDEVAFAPRQYGIPEDQIKNLVEKALKKVKLDDFSERIPLHLSGGERKRLALASVLSLQPRLLILDEPTAGLDPQGEELLLEILRELDTTLILVSHDIFFVRELTERVLVMHHGRIEFDCSMQEFIADENLTTLNGLDYTYRDHCALQIRELQHRHEHSHRHKHRHEHEHRHGNLVHTHPHDHEHEHAHSFTHSHDSSGSHQHPQQQDFHQHEHPNHQQENHDHEH